MKKKITIDGFQCDGCACDGCAKETEYAAECRNCQKTFCLACLEKEMREYTNRGKSFYYCLKCDVQLTQSCKDETHYLLRLIDKVRAEYYRVQDDGRSELNRLSERLETELKKQEK